MDEIFLMRIEPCRTENEVGLKLSQAPEDSLCEVLAPLG